MNLQSINWDNVPAAQMPSESGTVVRQFINGQTMTVARISFTNGAATLAHSHDNEQISLVISGEMEFMVEGETTIVRAGELIHLPSNSWHGAKANAESVLLDMFSPPRADWGPPPTQK